MPTTEVWSILLTDVSSAKVIERQRGLAAPVEATKRRKRPRDIGPREVRQQKLSHSSSRRRRFSRPGHSTLELVVVEVTISAATKCSANEVASEASLPPAHSATRPIFR